MYKSLYLRGLKARVYGNFYSNITSTVNACQRAPGLDTESLSLQPPPTFQNFEIEFFLIIDMQTGAKTRIWAKMMKKLFVY